MFTVIFLRYSVVLWFKDHWCTYDAATATEIVVCTGPKMHRDVQKMILLLESPKNKVKGSGKSWNLLGRGRNGADMDVKIFPSAHL